MVSRFHVLLLALAIPVAATAQSAQVNDRASLDATPSIIARVDVVPTASLPDAPAPQSAPAPSAGKATLHGTVLDPNGSAVASAIVTLTGEPGTNPETVAADDSGQFLFSNLAPGTYRLTVQAEGMGTFVNAEIELKAGDYRELPRIVLTVATTKTEVEVTAKSEEVAQAQITLQLEQRVFGVLPNFYTSYLWNAQKLDARQKFRLALHSVLDPTAFAGYGFIAGLQQATDQYPGYHQGAEGYGKRYGAAFANDAIGRIMGSAVYPSLFHQDPRYFYKGTGSKKSRAWYAVSQAFLCRGDNGHREINFSHILGTFTAAGMSNLYHPASDRGIGLTFSTGLIQTAGNAANNVVREFLFKRLTPKVPNYGQAEE